MQVFLFVFCSCQVDFRPKHVSGVLLANSLLRWAEFFCFVSALLGRVFLFFFCLVFLLVSCSDRPSFSACFLVCWAELFCFFSVLFFCLFSALAGRVFLFSFWCAGLSFSVLFLLSFSDRFLLWRAEFFCFASGLLG